MGLSLLFFLSMVSAESLEPGPRVVVLGFDGAISSDSWRFIQAPRPELYNLTDDPGETRNLVRAERDRLRELVGHMRRHDKLPKPYKSRKLADDPELAASLRSLGYLGGNTDGPSDQIDPKDGMALLTEMA